MNNVKQVRNAKGYSQAKVAALTGGTLTQGDISKIETEYYSRPSKKLKAEIAKALGVEESELFPQP